MRDFRKIIHEDVEWLFYHYEPNIVDIEKGVEPEREWDYVLKLKMGKARKHFKEPCRFGGFCLEKGQYNDCVNDERMKNNWMCWRDGIHEDEHGYSNKIRPSTPKAKMGVEK